MTTFYWRCQSHVQDSPIEYIAQAETKEQLELEKHNVCGGPYEEKEEAEFWLYGGPQCSITLLDLSNKEIEWLIKRQNYLDEKELSWLLSLNAGTPASGS